MSKIFRFSALVPGVDTVAYADADAFGTNIALTLPEYGKIVNVTLEPHQKLFSKYEKNWLYWVLKSEGVEHLEMK